MSETNGGELSSRSVELNHLLDQGKEADSKPPHCLYISGIAWTVNGVKEGLIKEYGDGNVDVFSSIFSHNRQNPQRFEQMADVIQKHAKEGLDIFAFSLGAAELGKVIKIIEKKDGTFFDNRENTEKLNIVLGSPSGFNKGIIGALKYIERTIKFNREEGSESNAATLRRGIDALTAFPPNGIAPAELAQALRRTMPEISQDREGIERITFDEGENYTPHLPEDQKEQVEIYSDLMRMAIKNDEGLRLRKLVVLYGKRFKGALDQVYAGEFDLADNREAMELPRSTILKTVGGRIELLKVFINAVGSAPMEQLEALQKKGVNIRFIVPEYDIYVKVEQLIAFLGGSGEKTFSKIKTVEGGAHQFPSLRRSEAGKVIKAALGSKSSNGAPS